MYIYLHLPFCTSICSYCDFPKLLYDKKYINSYLNSLKKEVKERYKQEKVKTIYIGGGTPTSLDSKELKKLLDITKLFNKEKNIEFTIESNIESLSKEKIKLLKQYGINRISLGVQSFQEKVLKELNRHHTNDMVFETIKNLKKENITNISIDYIYGVNTNIKKCIEDINTFLALDIPHISCYSLIIENNTIFKINNKENIKEDIEKKIYNTIESILEKNNYKHYEISSYAKTGYQSIHNLNYWNNGNYYGFGLGSVSFIDNKRISNTKNLTNYLKGKYIKEISYENKKIRMSNEIILGLRKLEGISIEKWET